MIRVDASTGLLPALDGEFTLPTDRECVCDWFGCDDDDWDFDEARALPILRQRLGAKEEGGKKTPLTDQRH